MTKLETALHAKWISKFGSVKVKQLSEGMDVGKTVAARSKALVESKSESELGKLLLEGFDGFFHQSIYIRKVKNATQSAKAMKEIPVETDSVNSVALEEMADTAADDEAKCLLMVTEKMEFLQHEGPTIFADIPFPVAVGISAGNLTVQVLTMQIAVDTWGQILGKELRRILTPVHADMLYEEALNFLRNLSFDVGDYVDYSSAAIELIKRNDVNLYCGTYPVGTLGSTKHDTVRGKGKRPLRESMPEKFQELVSAQRMIYAEIELGHDQLGLIQGTKIALHPTVGKIAFRSMLKGCNPDEFVKEMATPYALAMDSN